MQPNEIHQRSTTLSNACLKVSAVLNSNHPLVNYTRAELLRNAAELAIQTKGLMAGQIPTIFVERLNRSLDASNGCAFWLQHIVNEKMMDDNIVSPLIVECYKLSELFMGASKNAKSKIV